MPGPSVHPLPHCIVVNIIVNIVIVVAAVAYIVKTFKILRENDCNHSNPGNL